MQGACGDINPSRNTTDFADVDRYGLMLGGEILKVAARLSAPSAPALSPKLVVASAPATLTVRDLPEPATVHQTLAATTAALATASSADE